MPPSPPPQLVSGSSVNQRPETGSSLADVFDNDNNIFDNADYSGKGHASMNMSNNTANVDNGHASNFQYPPRIPPTKKPSPQINYVSGTTSPPILHKPHVTVWDRTINHDKAKPTKANCKNMDTTKNPAHVEERKLIVGEKGSKISFEDKKRFWLNDPIQQFITKSF